MKLLFVYPNEPMLNPPPVGIGVLTSILSRAGVSVDLFDTTRYRLFSQTSDKAKEENLQVRPFDFGERNVSFKNTDLHSDLRRKIESFSPELIAVSILEPTFQLSVDLLNTIQPYGIPVIAGGVFPTFAPDQILSHPAVNMVCVGEGEGALLDVCERLENGDTVSEIPNLAFKKGPDVLINRIRPVVDINRLPIPDYRLFEPERFFRPMAGRVYRAAPIETNRGCPYGCAFCNSPSQKKLYREQSAGNFFRKKRIDIIAEEIRHHIDRYDIEYIYFTSDTFLSMNDREFDQFIDFYGEIGLPFWIQTRPETINRVRANALKAIGCHRMSLGIEHGNYEFRKTVLKKKIANDLIIRASGTIADAGIPLTVNNIIGFPGETRELVFDTIALNRQLIFDTTNAYAFAPFHGTDLHERCVNDGLISRKRTVQNLTIDTALDMPQLPRSEIEGLRKTFALYARLPESFWPRIRTAEGDDEDAHRTFDELRSIYIQKFFSD
jgi:radical SAM superfamily enzyme YgiQ (UPF0313 family)